MGYGYRTTSQGNENSRAINNQYFFSYFTFGDAESSKLPPWPRSISESWNKGLESVRRHQLSPTGKAMRELLDDSGK